MEVDPEVAMEVGLLEVGLEIGVAVEPEVDPEVGVAVEPEVDPEVVVEVDPEVDVEVAVEGFFFEILIL